MKKNSGIRQKSLGSKENYLKQKLEMDSYADDYFSDCRLLGVMTTEKNYRFIWRLNNMLLMDFRLNEKDEIEINRRNRFYYFPVYSFRVMLTELHHFIYHNYSDGDYLLPEFKHIDFLWLMKGEQMLPLDYNNLLLKLKETQGVQLVAELPYEQLKNIGNLLI